jgi:hypothetical protein
VLTRVRSTGSVCAKLAALVLACVSLANASATLFLEEPYGKLGFFTATGHAAVYLSGVCAETPLVLRRCRPGETGVVISRYDGIEHYDWVAIPLIPYLYAVERAENVPLFVDANTVAALRDRYRREHLEALAPDGENGEAPGGNWYELVGSSYDRTIYAFQIDTTEEQDAALIRKLNGDANRSHFRTVSSNCADFAKGIINFYYPKSLHRSVIADVGITTPKQMAKTLVKFEQRHPQIENSHFIIGQVPGSTARSSAVHGVVESFFKSKKYMVPSVFISPIFAGCVFAVYEGVGAGRFQPARDALVLDSDGTLEQPIGHEDLRAFQLQLKNLLASEYSPASGQNVEKSWARLQAKATTEFDEQGRPVLEIEENGEFIRIGLSAENVLDGTVPKPLVHELMEARLQSELRPKPAREISEDEVTRDWELLEQAGRSADSSLAATTPPISGTFRVGLQ